MIGFQRNGQGGDLVRGAFQCGADRTRDGDASAEIGAVIDGSHYQVGALRHDLQDGMLHGLGRRSAHGINRPFLAVDDKRLRGDDSIRGAGHGAAHTRGLLAWRGNSHVAKGREGLGGRP